MEQLPDELREAGNKLLDCAYEFWNKMKQNGRSDGSVWIEHEGKILVIVSRPEHKETLLHNIGAIKDTEFFDLKPKKDGNL